jgi:ribose transport system substrate-binding protein
MKTSIEEIAKMKSNRKQNYVGPLRIAALVGGVAMSAMSFASDSVPVTKGADITAMCGTKPAVVALTDGYGGNTWRKITLAEFKEEAAKCKNITKVVYSNANGDNQKSNTDLNSFAAQGVNIIVSFTDFGDAMIPALRNAHKAGVTVVPYFTKLSGKPGKDYAAMVSVDTDGAGAMWADWVGKNVKTGNIVFLGGIPGASSSQAYLNGLKTGLKKYPGIKFLDESYIVTNWSPTDGQKAVAGLIAKYGKIDAIVSDYGVTTLAAIKAFEQAGLPIPAQATIASNNEMNCKYLEAKKAGKAWPYFSLDYTNRIATFALRRAMSVYEGTKNSEPMSVLPMPYIDSFSGMDPKCDASAPPDADLSSALPQDKLNALFK